MRWCVRAISISSLQRDARVRVAQAGAEQIREILHCLLGALRDRARQRSDGVHAVEEEVRADARLQRTDARQRFHLDAALPLGAHVEVAQRQRADDETDAEVAQQEAGVIASGRRLSMPGSRRSRSGRPGRRARKSTPTRRDQQRDGDQRRLRRRQRVQPGARAAQHGRAGQSDPQQEQRAAGEIDPEAAVQRLARDREHQRHELDDQHDREHRAAIRRNPAGRGSRADRGCRRRTQPSRRSAQESRLVRFGRSLRERRANSASLRRNSVEMSSSP